MPPRQLPPVAPFRDPIERAFREAQRLAAQSKAARLIVGPLDLVGNDTPKAIDQVAEYYATISTIQDRQLHYEVAGFVYGLALGLSLGKGDV